MVEAVRVRDSQTRQPQENSAHALVAPRNVLPEEGLIELGNYVRKDEAQKAREPDFHPLHGEHGTSDQLEAPHFDPSFHFVGPSLDCVQFELKETAHILEEAKFRPEVVDPCQRIPNEIARILVIKFQANNYLYILSDRTS